MDHFFYASHLRHNFPCKLDTYISELAEIVLKLSMKTVQVHYYWDDFNALRGHQCTGGVQCIEEDIISALVDIMIRVGYQQCIGCSVLWRGIISALGDTLNNCNVLPMH